MKRSKLKIQELCLISLFTAIIAILAQIAIPLPFGVPVTMQTFAIILASIILGAKKAALSTIIYMLLGAVGLPVFANLKGGFQALTGPTSGFILSFPLMAYIIGLGYQYRHKWKGVSILGLLVGIFINCISGLFFFCKITQSSLFVGFTTCVLPFIPTTLLTAILAAMLGVNIRRRLQAFF